jgi:ABC-type multidrug transport system fused ATPase/permease subunit
MKNIKEYTAIIVKVIKLSYLSSKKYTIILWGINIMIGIAFPISTFIWSIFIDKATIGILSNEWKIAALWLGGYSIFWFIQNILNVINEYIENILSAKLNIYTTDKIMKCIADLPMEYFDKSENYDKIQKVNTESNMRSMSIIKTLINLIQGILTMLGTVIILLQVNWIILIILFFLCIPTLVLSLNLSFEKYNIYNARVKDMRFISFLKNMMSEYENIKELRVNLSSEFFINYIDKKYREFLKVDRKIQSKYSFKMIGMDCIEQIIICSMRIYLLINVVIRNMSIGQLSLHINSIDNFRNSIITILNTMASIYEDGLYVNNLFEFLEIKNNIMRENQKYIQEISKVEFRHVWFKYPNTEKYILEDINFVIEKGKSYSFVGLNGSGKTTIIKLILNLYNPTRGEILVNDINLSNIDMEKYLSKIGVVFQDFMKYPLTISENISIASVRQMNNKNKIEKAAKLSGADQFINKLPKKYDTSLFREWEDGVQLSIGQWQKIAISRAFLEDFPVIILDEPTASLDAYAEFELYKKFKDIVKNKTSILIAHRFSTIKLADLIYVIKNGKIIESGSHNELMKLNGEYAYLYRIQSDAYVSK